MRYIRPGKLDFSVSHQPVYMVIIQYFHGSICNFLSDNRYGPGNTAWVLMTTAIMPQSKAILKVDAVCLK